ncbi:hypothetical protein RCL1_009106 [Eukaryota sp. TZLM3-RCL]
MHTTETILVLPSQTAVVPSQWRLSEDIVKSLSQSVYAICSRSPPFGIELLGTAVAISDHHLLSYGQIMTASSTDTLEDGLFATNCPQLTSLNSISVAAIGRKAILELVPSISHHLIPACAKFDSHSRPVDNLILFKYDNTHPLVVPIMTILPHGGHFFTMSYCSPLAVTRENFAGDQQHHNSYIAKLKGFPRKCIVPVDRIERRGDAEVIEAGVSHEAVGSPLFCANGLGEVSLVGIIDECQTVVGVSMYSV